MSTQPRATLGPRRKHPAGDPGAAIAAGIGAVIVRRGMDHHRRSVGVEQAGGAGGRAAGDREFEPPAAALVDVEIVEIAEMMALRIERAVLPSGLVPGRPGALEAGSFATPRGMKMDSVMAGGEPLRLDAHFDPRPPLPDLPPRRLAPAGPPNVRV